MGRRGELARFRSASQLVLLLLVAGLLGAFLLPWEHVSIRGNEIIASFAVPGIASAAAAVAAALAMCLPVAWSRPGAAPAERLGLAAAVAALHGRGRRLLPALLRSACLRGLARARVCRRPSPARAGGRPSALEAGGTILATTRRSVARACSSSLRSSCPGRDSATQQTAGSGRLEGTVSRRTPGRGPCRRRLLRSSLLALVVAVLEPRRLRLSVVELAAGFGLLVATIGFSLQEGGGGGFHVEHAYGSTIGFVLAAVLIALALVGSRLPTFDWRRAAVRLVPIGACAAYLAIIVLPMVGRASRKPFHTPPIYPPLSWLTIAGALLGIHLLGLWVPKDRRRSGKGRSGASPARAARTRVGRPHQPARGSSHVGPRCPRESLPPAGPSRSNSSSEKVSRSFASPRPSASTGSRAGRARLT